MIENRDAELLRLVGEVGGDAGAGENDNARGQDFEDAVVALEGRRLAVAGPVGLEGDLRNLAAIGPAGGGLLGAFGAAAMDEDHVRVFGEHLVEHGPDADVIVAIDAAGKGDLGPGRQMHLGLGAALGGDEVAAVDHGGRHGLMVDEVARAGTPGRAGLDLEALGGEVAHRLEHRALLEDGLALGNKPFEFDGAHLGAVLFGLRLLLPVFIIVELTLHAGGLFVEEIGERPQQIGDVGFEAGVAEGPGEDVEQVGHRAFEEAAFGQGARIGLVLVRMMAEELEFLDDAGGLG